MVATDTGRAARVNLRRAAVEYVGIPIGTFFGSLPQRAWSHGDYKRIYMYHVRKSAGTSIAFAFMRLAGIDPHRIERRLVRFTFAQCGGYRYVAHNLTLIRRGRYFFAQSHHPAHEVALPEAGTFRFTVLRDPIERVVSLYRYLADPAADSPYYFKAFQEEREWAAHGFDRFLDLTPRQHIVNQLYMFSKDWSVAEAVERLSGLNLVMRAEQLEQDHRALERALGLQLPLSRERMSLLAFAPTDAQIDRLREFLEPEFEMLRQIPRTGS